MYQQCPYKLIKQWRCASHIKSQLPPPWLFYSLILSVPGLIVLRIRISVLSECILDFRAPKIAQSSGLGAVHGQVKCVRQMAGKAKTGIALGTWVWVFRPGLWFQPAIQLTGHRPTGPVFGPLDSMVYSYIRRSLRWVWF